MIIYNQHLSKNELYMKVRIIQPAYSFDSAELDKNFKALCALIDGFNEPLDIIVMPEYSEIPAARPLLTHHTTIAIR